jgi:hypothetical protein
MNPKYRDANLVLAKAARNTLLGGVLIAAALAGLAASKVVEAGTLRLGLGFWTVVGGLTLWMLLSGWAGYRELRNLRLVEAGFEVHTRGERVLVPWEAIQEIELGRRGFRIRAHGHRPFSVNLAFASDTRPLLAVINAKRPQTVQLRI